MCLEWSHPIASHRVQLYSHSQHNSISALCAKFSKHFTSFDIWWSMDNAHCSLLSNQTYMGFLTWRRMWQLAKQLRLLLRSFHFTQRACDGSTFLKDLSPYESSGHFQYVTNVLRHPRKRYFNTCIQMIMVQMLGSFHNLTVAPKLGNAIAWDTGG